MTYVTREYTLIIWVIACTLGGYCFWHFLKCLSAGKLIKVAIYPTRSSRNMMPIPRTIPNNCSRELGSVFCL